MSSRRLVAAAFLLIAGLAVVPFGASRADKSAMGIIVGAVGFLTYSAIANPPQDREPDVLSVGAGVSDPVEREHFAGLFQLEYRPELWGMRTGALVGIAGTTSDEIFAYVGLRHDILFADRFLASLNLSLAAYRIDPQDNELASLGQFRTGFDVQYILPDRSRVGVSFQHLSNAEVFEKRNPGTETLAFTYTIPFGRL